MTKSFLISLAGFAIGLGVTTALTFITPGLDTGEGHPWRMCRLLSNRSPCCQNVHRLKDRLQKNRRANGIRPRRICHPLRLCLRCHKVLHQLQPILLP
jgi:hypothetical protein